MGISQFSLVNTSSKGPCSVSSLPECLFAWWPASTHFLEAIASFFWVWQHHLKHSRSLKEENVRKRRTVWHMLQAHHDILQHPSDHILKTLPLAHLFFQLLLAAQLSMIHVLWAFKQRLRVFGFFSRWSAAYSQSWQGILFRAAPDPRSGASQYGFLRIK